MKTTAFAVTLRALRPIRYRQTIVPVSIDTPAHPWSFPAIAAFGLSWFGPIAFGPKFFFTLAGHYQYGSVLWSKVPLLGSLSWSMLGTGVSFGALVLVTAVVAVISIVLGAVTARRLSRVPPGTRPRGRLVARAAIGVSAMFLGFFPFYLTLVMYFGH